MRRCGQLVMALGGRAEENLGRLFLSESTLKDLLPQDRLGLTSYSIKPELGLIISQA